MDLRYETDGCTTSSIAGSQLVKMIENKSLKDALKLTPQDILDALGKFPEENHHCALLAVDTMKQTIEKKLTILADSAKYDVSCASSGSNRGNAKKGIGTSVGCGICHSFTEDGRCISLLKVLMTNHCIYDCAYCINRHSNDRPRATFTPKELSDLTIDSEFAGKNIQVTPFRAYT